MNLKKGRGQTEKRRYSTASGGSHWNRWGKFVRLTRHSSMTSCGDVWSRVMRLCWVNREWVNIVTDLLSSLSLLMARSSIEGTPCSFMNSYAFENPRVTFLVSIFWKNLPSPHAFTCNARICVYRPVERPHQNGAAYWGRMPEKPAPRRRIEPTAKSRRPLAHWDHAQKRVTIAIIRIALIIIIKILQLVRCQRLQDAISIPLYIVAL